MRHLLLVGAWCLTVTLAAAETNSPPVSFTRDGSLVVQGSASVPPYAGDGRWTEMAGKSSARYITRHFLFSMPAGPPAIELYVTRDLADGRPDGAFEIGLVTGFLSGFSAKAGFTHAVPVFEDALIGRARVKRCRVALAMGETKLWLYAYVFPRRPSLTFLTLRPRGDASASIEDYLASVRLE